MRQQAAGRVLAALDPLQDWARNKAVRRSLFINAVGQQDAGLGWEVCYLGGEEMWTVQMWLPAEDYDGPRSANLVHPLRQALTPHASCAILDLKEQHAACALPYRSIDLYRAVLDDGIETMEEFNRWKQSNSSTGLLAWAPTDR
jgi:hypothetical protein